ncbi:MAG: VWA domain-containing protein [Pirellulaceae bacterium]|jgi:hypothetical protein|nr:VWA domain-containing protein [Pirellulaceae bacterium]
MNFGFLNSIGWLQWGLLAAIPPAIIALYFLKLKRQPLEVPSTYLWSRTIEDLHVNSIWQKLRKSLLLFLQLLLIALIILSLLRPGWKGNSLIGDRFIFIVDTSASMAANDVKPTRLENAKERIEAMIDEMESGQVAMILSVSNSVKVEQSFTDNRRLLRKKLAAIKQTNRTSNIDEALRYAAGLANPGRTSTDATDVQVADALAATLYIFSDGGFPKVDDFYLENLQPQYLRIGSDEATNVGIGSFTIARNPEKPDQLQAFARVDNFGVEDLTIDVTLFIDGEMRDVEEIEIPKKGRSSVQFNMDDFDEGELKLVLDYDDNLPVDNVAYVAANLPRRAKVLLVTPGNDPLAMALGTEAALKYGEIGEAKPAILETEKYKQQTAAGAYDLIIYDRCVPKEMPQANTLFFGAAPPIKEWVVGKKEGPPLIVDTDRVHPLMQLIDMGNVNIIESLSLKPPPGGSKLIYSDIGYIAAVAPRQGFEDVVFGFDIYSTGSGGVTEVNTDWHIRRSFPVFIMNAVKYLGGSRGASASLSIAPGEPATLRSRLLVDSVRVTSPNNVKSPEIRREGENTFVYTETEELGVYAVHEGTAKEVGQRFAVNLFNERESDIYPETWIHIDEVDVQPAAVQEQSRKELWKWILLLGLVVLVFEWYVYNRRVYL